MGLFNRDNQVKARFALRQMRRRAKGLTEDQLAAIDRALASNDVMDGLADYIEVEEEVLASEPRVGGPIADAFAMLIQDFIQNPEKWIKIIMMLFAV